MAAKKRPLLQSDAQGLFTDYQTRCAGVECKAALTSRNRNGRSLLCMSCAAEREQVLAPVSETDEDGGTYFRYPNQSCTDTGCGIALDSRVANAKAVAAGLCNHHHWAAIEAKDKLKKLKSTVVTGDLAARRLARAQIRASSPPDFSAPKAVREAHASKMAALVAIADPRGTEAASVAALIVKRIRIKENRKLAAERKAAKLDAITNLPAVSRKKSAQEMGRPTEDRPMHIAFKMWAQSPGPSLLEELEVLMRRHEEDHAVHLKKRVVSVLPVSTHGVVREPVIRLTLPTRLPPN